MIKVFIPSDYDFNYKECKKLFKKYRKEIAGDWDFAETVKNSFFYSFFSDNTFLGCIFYYMQDGKMFVGAYAHRGHHLLNLECFRISLQWFNCDIYANSIQKTAILCLKKIGFKKIDENLYKYERKKIWQAV